MNRAIPNVRSRGPVAAVIPARGGSKGIPGKNIMDFCGKPLVAWSIEQALASRSVTDVFVSSDCQKILDISASFGAIAVRRPAALSGDTAATEPALLHCLRAVEKRFGQPADAVVFLQATSPLREAEDIDGAVEAFFRGGYDSLFSAVAADDICLWKQGSERPESFTYDYRKRGRRQDRTPFLLENGSLYVFAPATLRTYNNRLGGAIGVYLMERWKAFEIDNHDDIALCEYYFRGKCLDRRNNAHAQ